MCVCVCNMCKENYKEWVAGVLRVKDSFLCS